MRSRLMILLALALITGALITGAAHGDELTSADHRMPSLLPVFSDDFAKDTLAAYDSQGKLTWERGKLVLHEKASVERPSGMGPWAKLDLEVAWPNKPDSHADTEMRVWFLMDGATDCYVRLRITLGPPDLTLAVALVDTGEEDGEPIEHVVRQAMSKDQDFNQITLEYRYGLVRVVAGATTVMQAYIPNGSASIAAHRIEAVHGIVHVQKLAASASRADSRDLSEDERERLAAAEAANKEMISRYQQGKFAEAVEIGAQVIDVRKSLLGELHPDYATSLNNLAVLYEELGDRARAEELHLHVIEVTRATLGEQHPEYAISLNNLAELYRGSGDYTRAEPLHLQALEIKKAVFGEQHPVYATSLANLGDVYQGMGEYVRAEAHYHAALEIKQSTLGEQDSSYATTLSRLGTLYRTIGDYARAEQLLRQSVNIRKVLLGEDHPNYAESLDALAKLYLNMGEYAQAEPLYKQSQAIRKAGFGEQHPAYAASLNEMAYLYFVMGDYARSEPLFKQALAIKSHPDVAASLNNLALLYESKGDFAQAESLYRKALETTRETLGEQHPAYAISLSNLAMLFGTSGDYVRWEQLQTQAMEIKRSMLGEKHPSYASSLHNLAELFHVRGDHSRAEPMYLQARDIRKSVLGEQHPAYAVSLFGLALFYESARDVTSAAPLYAQALAIVRHNLNQTSLVQSSRQQLRNQSKMRRYLDRRLAHAVQHGAGATPVLSDVWQWKGAVTTRQQAYRQVAANPMLNPLFAKLKTVTRQLSTMSDRAPVPPPSSSNEETQQVFQREREHWQRRFTQLNRQREDLEQQIALESASFRRIRQPLTVAEVRSRLPKGSAFVDFIAYNHPLSDPGDLDSEKQEQRFVAFVLRSDGEPSMIGLGSVDQLAAFIVDFRRPFTRDSVTPRDLEVARKAGRQIRAKLWLPIETHLAGIDTVVISPDSILGTLPFAALPGKESGGFLVEDYKLATVPMAQELPLLFEEDEAAVRNDGLLVVGDVDYDARAVPLLTETAPPRLLQQRTPGPITRGDRSRDWDSLPGFRQELETVQLLHRRSVGPSSPIATLSGGRASEVAFADLAPRFKTLHLITHGYFQDPNTSAIGQIEFESDRFSAQGRGPDQFINAWMPGLLSGLVMAGANQPTDHPDDPHDGILRASEIEASSLRGVDLVVLSACETGLGPVAGGEGLTGLQRAFHVAGARTVIASLWKVEDHSTHELMKRFYTNLWGKKLSKLDALREAQLWLLDHPQELEALGVTQVRTRGTIRDAPQAGGKAAASRGRDDRTSPFFWAAFQLSGDWR